MSSMKCSGDIRKSVVEGLILLPCHREARSTPLQPSNCARSLAGYGCRSMLDGGGFSPNLHAQSSLYSPSSLPSTMSAIYPPMIGKNLKPWRDPAVAMKRFLCRGISCICRSWSHWYLHPCIHIKNLSKTFVSC